MRVLLLDNEKSSNLDVIELIRIGYEDDITNVIDDDGNYDRYTVNPISGLYMVDKEGDYLYIEGISKDECNRICEEILIKGYADLRKYGPYNYEWYYEDVDSDSSEV